MSAISYLKDYVDKTNPIIQGFFASELKQAQKVSPVSADMIRRFADFMKGGKRLRGAQIVLGYQVAGGKDNQAVLKASSVIEIIHAFLLMHDDIMDQDSLRRGQPTLHKQFEQLHRGNGLKRDSSHYGLSMAIDTGDIGMFLASKILSDLPFPAEHLLRVHHFLNNLLIEVGYGQALDVTYESYDSLSIDDVLRVHRYKAADYTVSGPLIMGGLLAGKSLNELQAFYQYGLPVGIAFQLRDDELGVFSKEEILGKPTDSDIREGKNTLLIVHALKHTKVADRKFLKSAHGNSNINQADMARVRQIIKDCGALDYSQKLSRQLVEKGKSAIPNITSDHYYQQLLAQLADFMIERDS